MCERFVIIVTNQADEEVEAAAGVEVESAAEVEVEVDAEVDAEEVEVEVVVEVDAEMAVQGVAVAAKGVAEAAAEVEVDAEMAAKGVAAAAAAEAAADKARVRGVTEEEGAKNSELGGVLGRAASPQQPLPILNQNMASPLRMPM